MLDWNVFGYVYADEGAVSHATPVMMRLCIVETVTAVDDTVFEGATATAPWQQVLKAVNNKNQGRSKVTVSGPQFFGLAIEPIFLQIRQLPGYAEVAGGLM